MNSRIAWWVLGAFIVAAGATLRFWGLGDLGISQWDAGTYVAGPLGIGPYGKAEILLFYAPPLVPWLHELLFALNGSPSDTLALGLHALIGTLTVLATGVLGCRLLGRPAGWVGAAALAGMEYHVVYSRQPLTEASYTLLFVLAIGAGFAGWRDGRMRAWIQCGLWTGAACLVKYHGFFPLVVLAAFALLVRRSPSGGASAKRGLLLAGLVTALPVAALLVLVANEVGLAAFRENRAQWLPEPGLYLIPQTARYLFACLTAWVSPVVLVAAVVGVFVLAARRRPGGVIVLLWLALFVGTLPLYKNYPRLPVPMLPALALAAGAGLVALVGRLRAKAGETAAATAVLAAFVLAADVGSLRDTLSVSDRGYADLAQWLGAVREPPGQALGTGGEVTVGPASPHPDILVTQHAVLPYLLDAPHPFVCYDEPEALQALQRGEFRHLVFDLRSLFAPDFTAWRDAHRDELERVATLDNPLPEAFLVNAAGFEALDDLRDPDTSAARREELTTIRVWRRR